MASAAEAYGLQFPSKPYLWYFSSHQNIKIYRAYQSEATGTDRAFELDAYVGLIRMPNASKTEIKASEYHSILRAVSATQFLVRHGNHRNIKEKKALEQYRE